MHRTSNAFSSQLPSEFEFDRKSSASLNITNNFHKMCKRYKTEPIYVLLLENGRQRNQIQPSRNNPKRKGKLILVSHFQ